MEQYQHKVPNPHRAIYLDVQTTHDTTPGLAKSLGFPPDPESGEYPDEVVHYEGIWIHNPLLGQKFFPKNRTGDFGEFHVAYTVAEDWADELMDQFNMELDYEKMIFFSPPLTAFLNMLTQMVSNPKHPSNPASPDYKLSLN